MKIKTYWYRSHKLNTKSNSSVMQKGFLWLLNSFVACRPTDFFTDDRIRSQKTWREFLDPKTKSKIDSLIIFQVKCKKTTLNPATVEYQLNDSLFSSFNETSSLRWWMYECYILKLRDEEIKVQNIMTACATVEGTQIFFCHLIFDSFIACSLTLLSSKQEGF